ncbi:ABC transporter substrate-binding protein [Dethiosulfatarculus sandiegensis]|uniref:Amino acid ABC transporter substrate-binding protein n=1 Tax=Dethiosulfatarculus sandiegensis TaxID=1429043 RepID=A0A0D2JDG3_9BACT|nr:ABC transporter substrate-binding protein [Dethiosulfatarculus sandiegensis]KIX13751.1 amino acid ABC transporter substrate-binding protein [Dethiosulfatarculus sandiegensis]
MAKRIAKLLVLACLAMGLALPTTAFSAEKTYVNGIDANFPPFAFVDKTGKPNGFDVEAVDWIAAKLGFKVVHKPMDWDGIIPSLNAKKIDFIASGMSITKARAKVVNFSIPYWTIKQVMVVPKDSKLTPKDILKSGKGVGVQRGTSEAKWLKTNMDKMGWKFDRVLYDSAPLSVEDMLNGRIVAAIMDDAPAKDMAAKKPIKILGEFGMPTEDFGYAVRKADKDLLEMLNKGIKMLKASPKWAELEKKYELK